MLKRPIDPRFNAAVLSGSKITTIRNSYWPCDTPIMLYNWEGKPYASKHLDVAAVIVRFVRPITITHPPGGMLHYEYGHYLHGRFLWDHEGFPTRHAMDAWFRPLVKPGHSLTQFLMHFRLLDPSDQPDQSDLFNA